jgi:cyanophycinase
MDPKGKLIIIGGAVDTGSFTEKQFNQPNNLNFFEHGILKRIIIESVKGELSRIEVIPTASQIPDAVGEEYIKAFEQLNVSNVGVMNIQSREEANNPEFIERLKNADVLMMTGGDQLRLTSILGGTAFHTLMLKKYKNEHFVIAGTSAGAAACSNNMIYQGSSSEALLKGEVKMTGGLNLINDVVIDTHFVQRGRIGRLFQAVASNPGILGIGLGEDTGLLIKHDNTMEAIGSGFIILVDGCQLKNTNITDVPMGTPISIENLVVHVMALHDVYDLEERKLKISIARKEFAG